MKTSLRKSILLLTSLIISLLLCETIMRLVNGNQFYIWPPHLKQYFLPERGIFPGIKDTSFFEINSLGFRGDEFDNSASLHVVAIGGSTTECLYLDQKEAWPAVLQKLLNHSQGRKCQVFNGGQSGLNSQHHVIQVQKLLERYKWIDVIIVMMGINDLQFALAGEEYRRKSAQAIYDEAFHISPVNSNLRWYQRSYLFRELSKIKKTLFSSKLGEDPFGQMLERWRYNRAHARKIVEREPVLERSLSEYHGNVLALIAAAQAKQKRIIFLTQPVAWGDDMPEQMQQLCWFGWIGKSQEQNTGTYYSFASLKKSMDKYNEVLASVCRENHIECLDLEKRVEKNTATFYDDCHFNENGANQVAGIIAASLSAAGGSATDIK